MNKKRLIVDWLKTDSKLSKQFERKIEEIEE